MSFHDLENFEKKLDKTIEQTKEQTDDYVNGVNQLYSQVEQWLNPLIKGGKVTLNRVEETLSELNVQDYNLNALELQVNGKKIVFLNPKGIQAKASIAHKGVVEMQTDGNKSVYKLVLANDDSWKYETADGKCEQLDEAKFNQLFKSLANL